MALFLCAAGGRACEACFDGLERAFRGCSDACGSVCSLCFGTVIPFCFLWTALCHTGIAVASLVLGFSNGLNYCWYRGETWLIAQGFSSVAIILGSYYLHRRLRQYEDDPVTGRKRVVRAECSKIMNVLMFDGGAFLLMLVLIYNVIWFFIGLGWYDDEVLALCSSEASTAAAVKLSTKDCMYILLIVLPVWCFLLLFLFCMVDVCRCCEDDRNYSSAAESFPAVSGNSRPQRQRVRAPGQSSSARRTGSGSGNSNRGRGTKSNRGGLSSFLNPLNYVPNSLNPFSSSSSAQQQPPPTAQQAVDPYQPVSASYSFAAPVTAPSAPTASAPAAAPVPVTSAPPQSTLYSPAAPSASYTFAAAPTSTTVYSFTQTY